VATAVTLAHFIFKEIYMTTSTSPYAAEIAAAQARLAAATAEVEDLRAKLKAEHADSQRAQQDDDTVTGRAVSAADGRAAAAKRFGKADDEATDGAQDTAAAGLAAARRRFGARS
jgi:hypothetical protein